MDKLEYLIHYLLTENGLKNIEDIKVGDKVYSVNVSTNITELKPVLQTFLNKSTEICKIYIGNEIIETTPRHQFYVVDKGWVRAYELEEGDVLFGEENRTIDKIEMEYYQDNPVNVYNLTVEGHHNYLITEYQLLVHNVASPT